MQVSRFTRRGFAQLLAAGAVAAQDRSDSDIPKAMEAVKEAIPKAEADPARPVYHFHPPAQWNNDANGTIYYKGWHHLFYQFNPYDAKWGHMHWGHARSRDLVNWEHLPIALGPSVEKGEEHIYSGAAILAADGRPRLIYTSIGPKRDPEQWMAVPADEELIVWRKYAGNPIATTKLHGDRKISDWRDPFMFQEGGKTYMVCGSNNNHRAQSGSAQVQLYEAVKPDLTEWKYRGPVFEYRDREVPNIECPNLFKLGSKWVLLISPHRAPEFFVGDLDLARGKFTPETHGVLDPGSSYASNISHDDKGRAILWLWGKTDTRPEMGWNSCMVIPRILTIDQTGFLRQDPVPEFEALRGEARTLPAAALDDKPVPLGDGDCVEIRLELSCKTATAVGLRVRGNTEISYDPRGGNLTAGKVKKLLGQAQPVRLRIFLDKRVMEVYANDGQAAIFTTIDGGPTDLAMEAFARGGSGRLESCTIWALKPARFSMERFKL